MIRAVVDTNTLASGALAHTGAIAELVDAWKQGALEIVISEHILAELERTLRKPYFSARLDDSARGTFLSLLIEFATLVEVVVPIPSVVSGFGDNIVLATALSAQVPYIVSGDRELQRLHMFQGIRIVSAREFLEIAFSRSDAIDGEEEIEEP